MYESLHTLFLAQALGYYLIIIAIIMLSRAKYYQGILSTLDRNNSSFIVSASIGLIIGIILVLIHNIWVVQSEVLVTLIAWLIVIKSIFWLAFPEMMVKYAQRLYSGPGYYVVAIVAGIIGIILLAHGVFPFRGEAL